MKNYGFSYMGSKSKLAERIVSILPSAENFYDLFAGGCAITHRAMIENRWKNYYANDILGTPQLFKEAIEGKYRNENRWVSREDFLKEKDNNLYVKFIWSFGNNGKSYLYSKEREKIKKELHEYLFSHGYDGKKETRLKLIKQFYLEKTNSKQVQHLQQLENLEQLERLQELEKLKNLESFKRLFISSVDYRDVKIKLNSVVYCDIPYKGTERYQKDIFDYNCFWDFFRSLECPAFASEYEAPKDIKIIAEFSHKSTFAPYLVKRTTERIFWNGKGNYKLQTKLI